MWINSKRIIQKSVKWADWEISITEYVELAQMSPNSDISERMIKLQVIVRRLSRDLIFDAEHISKTPFQFLKFIILIK